MAQDGLEILKAYMAMEEWNPRMEPRPKVSFLGRRQPSQGSLYLKGIWDVH